MTGGAQQPRSLIARLVALLILNVLLWSQGLHIRIHRGHAPLSSSSHFFQADLFIWSAEQAIPNLQRRPRRGCVSKIHRQHTSILNLLSARINNRSCRRSMQACVWWFDTCPTLTSHQAPSFLPRTCNLIYAPASPLGRLYSSVSCRFLIYCFSPLTLALWAPFTPR